MPASHPVRRDEGRPRRRRLDAARRHPAPRPARQRRPATARRLRHRRRTDRGDPRHDPHPRVRRRLHRPSQRCHRVRRLPVPRLHAGTDYGGYAPRSRRTAGRPRRQGHRAGRPRSSTRTTATSPPSPSSGTSATSPPPTQPSGTPCPCPDAGNVLTPRRVPGALARRSTTNCSPRHRPQRATQPATAPVPGSCFGGSRRPDRRRAGHCPDHARSSTPTPKRSTDPHHDYPAWDWIIPVNTPIYAVRGGTVATVRTWPHNWWTEGCGTDSTGCDTCGIGLTIVDADGTRWTYCHGSNLTVTLGDDVAAGQQVMWSGNTGRSGAPAPPPRDPHGRWATSLSPATARRPDRR